MMGDPRLTRWDRVRRYWYRHEDRILQVFAICGAIVLVALMATGCSMVPRENLAHEERHCEGWQHTGQPPFYEWTQTRPASVKPWVYVNVADVDFTCRTLGADPHRKLDHITACATWKPKGCTIYLPLGELP